MRLAPQGDGSAIAMQPSHASAMLVPADTGGIMPFVNIRLIEGRSQQQKDEIAQRVDDVICDVLKVPKDDTWVVFEDVPAEAWYVGGTTVAELRKKTPT
jgi:4-oxalocrotonate tautomerase